MDETRFASKTRVSRKFESHHYEARVRVLKAFFLLLAATGIGTLGYHIIEDWALFDSFYMTVITLATVGYGETHELSANGRLFTIFLIISSFGIVGYGVSCIAAFVVEGEFRHLFAGKNMDKRISKMSGHVILCGAGHNGLCIAREFHNTSTPFVLIEKDPDEMELALEIGDIAYVQDDATKDEALRDAGIDKARALITALSDDKDNTYVVLSARSLNPELHIVARNIESENAGKLLKAGADDVVSPNAIGGMRMASIVIRPDVVQFLDAMIKDSTSTIRFNEVRLGSRSSLLGETVASAGIKDKTGLLVLGIKRTNGEYLFNPDDEVKFESGDILLVMGSKEQVTSLTNNI